MRPTTVVGVLLIILGVAMLVTGGYSYQKNDKVLDAGPLQASVTHDKRVSIPPILSGIVVAAGVALMFVGNRQRT
jgi:uncharacterized membrane protein YidH (DUF202 family)